MKLKHIAAAALVATGLMSNAMAVQVSVAFDTYTATYDTANLNLFVAPTASGQQLAFFQNSDFAATVVGSGIDTAFSVLPITITAKSGYSLTSVSLAESGDYSYWSVPAANSYIGVDVAGTLRVTPSGGPVSVAQIVESTTYTPNTIGDFTTKEWAASAGAIALTGLVTTANVTIENHLGAYVLGTQGYANIVKKEVFLSVATAPVPEPETYAMMLAGLGAIGFLASRRRG